MKQRVPRQSVCCIANTTTSLTVRTAVRVAIVRDPASVWCPWTHVRYSAQGREVISTKQQAMLRLDDGEGLAKRESDLYYDLYINIECESWQTKDIGVYTLEGAK